MKRRRIHMQGMESMHTKRKTKRLLYSIGAIVTALALAIGGTFAYRLSEHKSNKFKNNAKYQARLVEEFTSPDDWRVGQEIDKKVSVKNMGGEKPDFPGTGWGDIFVRVQLKEYMEILPVKYKYYQEDDENIRFMVDTDGNFVKFAVTATVEQGENKEKEDIIKDLKDNPSKLSSVIDDSVKAKAFASTLTSKMLVKIKGLYDDKAYYYLKTKENDPNGQYGAFVVESKIAGEGVPVNGIHASKAKKHEENEHPNDECKYDIHRWDGAETPHGCDIDTHKYVEWLMGEEGVDWILASDWLAGDGSGEAGGAAVDMWILDDVSAIKDQGWAYWGNALPQFEEGKTVNETALLLNKVRLINQPEGDFEYVIHVDMEAVDWSDMQKDTEKPWIIEEAVTQAEPLKIRKSNVEAYLSSLTYELESNLKNAAGDDVISWEIDPDDGSVAAISLGRTAGTSLNLLAGGIIEVTGTVTAGTHKDDTVKFTLTVIDDVTQPLPDVTVKSGTVTVNQSAGTYSLADNLANLHNDDVVSWSVPASGSSVAAVSGGTLTLKGPGTVTVTATITEGPHAGTVKTFDVTVTPLTLSVKSSSVTAKWSKGTYNLASNLNNLYGNDIVSWVISPDNGSFATLSGGALTVTGTGAVAVTGTVTSGPHKNQVVTFTVNTDHDAPPPEAVIPPKGGTDPEDPIAPKWPGMELGYPDNQTDAILSASSISYGAFNLKNRTSNYSVAPFNYHKGYWYLEDVVNLDTVVGGTVKIDTDALAAKYNGKVEIGTINDKAAIIWDYVPSIAEFDAWEDAYFAGTPGVADDPAGNTFFIIAEIPLKNDGGAKATVYLKMYYQGNLSFV